MLVVNSVMGKIVVEGLLEGNKFVYFSGKVWKPGKVVTVDGRIGKVVTVRVRAVKFTVRVWVVKVVPVKVRIEMVNVRRRVRAHRGYEEGGGCVTGRLDLNERSGRFLFNGS